MIPQISHFSAKARPTDMVFKVINKRIIKKTKKCYLDEGFMGGEI